MKFKSDIQAESKVGIGTNTVNYPLDVRAGSANSDIAQFTGANDSRGLKISTFQRFTADDSVDYDCQYSGAAPIVPAGAQTWSMSGNEKMRLTQGGTLGIGTTSPIDPLVVRDGTSDTSVKILSFNNTTGTEAILKFSTFASETNNVKAAIIAKNDGGGIFGWSDMHFALDSVADNSNVQFSDTKMTILNGGNVGIGTTSPDAKLEVSSSSGGVLRLTSSDTSVATGESIGRVEFKSNDASTGGNNVMGFVDCLATNAGSTYALTFGTGNAAAATEKMRIEPSGNVGMGTTNLTTISTAVTTLSLGSTAASTSGGIAFQANNVVKAYNYVTNNYLINQTVAGVGQTFYGAGSERMRIHNTTGNVGIGTISPQSKLQVNGGVQLASDTASPSADKAGTFRYRTSGNNSYVDMCMQTGATTYAWVNIVQNNW